jgi:outer membrane protein OmpA-like peptidoglycan-associated protein
MDAIKANSGRYKVEDAGINSPYSDYGTTLYSDKMVFASARDTGSLGHRRHTWTGQPFTKLYVSDVGEEMSLGSPEKFDQSINSKFNESTPVFTKDGKTIYFTRNNYLDGKKGKDGNDNTLVKIYKASLENEKWVNITELPFDSDNYSTAHPILSPDEKTMYFVSDMPGTIGLSDLFKVQINDDGTFGNPVNLGRPINTEGRETFPFVNDDNEIYFASDGHPGLGGLDIFVSKINADGTFGKVQNVGMDANSPKDDFGYWIDTKSRRGFFSSNRDGGQGYDDIYKFLETKRLLCEQELFGKVTDTVTSEILVGAKISLFDKRFNPMGTVKTDDKGVYTFTVECGKTYNVRAEKEDYITKEESVNIADENGKTKFDIALKKAQCKVTVGDDLGKCFGIKNIYFDFDKSNIRIEAAIDLEKILDVMNQYPKMKLDIRSHTDSRGSFKYNESLSDRRAQSTIAWLIENGVDKVRLTAKGYGENQLINKCADNVDCTEEEHQLNRRSEFIIMEL